MKSISLNKSLIALLFITITGFVQPHAAHAQIPGDAYIKTEINAGKGNAFLNRDNRNQLLEKIKTDQSSRPLTPEEKQAALIKQLSVIISNLTNIHDRIALRTTEESTSGEDISNIVLLLASSSDEIAAASSTIAQITNVASTTSTSTISFDTHAAIGNTIDLINSAKNTLQQALNTLEHII